MKKWMLSFCLLWLLVLSGGAFAQTGEVKNGYWLNGGQIMQLREGRLEPLTEPVVLPSGLTLLPNGDLVTREGVRRNLRPGQAIDASGRILFPQTQRNGSVVLVPRSAYIQDRDPGAARQRRAGRPEVQMQYPRSGAPASRPPVMHRKSGPPPGKAPGHFRNRPR